MKLSDHGICFTTSQIESLRLEISRQEEKGGGIRVKRSENPAKPRVSVLNEKPENWKAKSLGFVTTCLPLGKKLKSLINRAVTTYYTDKAEKQQKEVKELIRQMILDMLLNSLDPVVLDRLTDEAEALSSSKQGSISGLLDESRFELPAMRLAFVKENIVKKLLNMSNHTNIQNLLNEMQECEKVTATKALTYLTKAKQLLKKQ